MRKALVLCLSFVFLLGGILHAANGDLIVNGNLSAGSAQVTQYGYASQIGGNNLYWNGFKSNAPTGMWGFQQSERAFFGVAGSVYSQGFSPNAIAVFNGSTTAEDIVLLNKNGGDAGRLVLKASGNVGIGTSSPTQRLDVRGGSLALNGALTFTDAAGTSFASNWIGMVNWVEGTKLWLHIGGITDVGGDNLRRVGIWADKTYMAGNVGIGTLNPQYALDVAGSIRANNVTPPSDIKFKDNIRIINSPLDRVLNLHGVSFNWKRDEFQEKNFPQGNHFGVIAQEIEKVLPEVVDTAPDGTKAVAYMEIIPVLIEAIKEQQKEIERQRAKLERLENMIAER